MGFLASRDQSRCNLGLNLAATPDLVGKSREANPTVLAGFGPKMLSMLADFDSNRHHFSGVTFP